jgi:uncharacterized protein
MQIANLLESILEGYTLSRHGIHGLAHWGRVLENGLRLAPDTGANVEVVTLFALFHDARRFSDGTDPGHGLRGAELARTLRGVHFEMTDADFDLLHTACALHTDGLTEADPTVQTCWDADRLDLGRVGITPHPRRLCTKAAKHPDVIAWANRRARQDTVPEVVREFLGW